MQVHRNAFVATMALLKQNLCVKELETNLDVFTHISQQRNDNMYRADARKLLQAIAAVRLDPDNPQFNDVDCTEEDVGSACPVTVNNREGRERSISDEGKKLFLANHGIQYPDRTESVGAISELGLNHSETISHIDPRYKAPHHLSNNEYDGESHLRATSIGYTPSISLVADTGTKEPILNSGKSLGSNFTEHSVPEVDKPNGSAFGFISGSDFVNDDSSRDDSTNRSSGQPISGFAPQRSPVSVDTFLLEYPSVNGSTFDDLWESANESYVISV